MAKKKIKSLAKLSEQAAELLQLLVRLESADDNGYVQCVTCKTKKHYKDSMQGGHFISRKWTATRLMKENIHPQCSYCNGPLRGNMVQYTLFMVDMYGREFVDALETTKHQAKRFIRSELEDQIKEWRTQIRELESQISGVAA